MPWVNPPPGGMKMIAYDLAEWTSLTPSVRQSAPFLWTSLLLRIPFITIGLILTMTIQRFQVPQPTSWAILILMVIALLPPLEFFTIYRDDINYQQQCMLAITALIAGAYSLLRDNVSKWKRLILVYASVGCTCSFIGLLQANALMNSFRLTISMAYGGALTILMLGLVAWFAAIKTE